jgi:hypothetical protein
MVIYMMNNIKKLYQNLKIIFNYNNIVNIEGLNIIIYNISSIYKDVDDQITRMNIYKILSGFKLINIIDQEMFSYNISGKKK